MGTQTILGSWNVLKADVKAAFDELTDEDLRSADGNADRVVEAIRERYGMSQAEAEEAWQAFVAEAGVVVAEDGHVSHVAPSVDGAPPAELERLPLEADIERGKKEVEFRDIRRGI